MKNKILWKKPDYKNKFNKVIDKEIDSLCKENATVKTGDIIIQREQYGRKISFLVYRIEKIGELIEGLDTLSRNQLLEELKMLEKEIDKK